MPTHPDICMLHGQLRVGQRVVWGTHKGYLDIIYFVILSVMGKYENVINKMRTSMASKSNSCNKRMDLTRTTGKCMTMWKTHN